MWCIVASQGHRSNRHSETIDSSSDSPSDSDDDSDDSDVDDFLKAAQVALDDLEAQDRMNEAVAAGAGCTNLVETQPTSQPAPQPAVPGNGKRPMRVCRR